MGDDLTGADLMEQLSADEIGALEAVAEKWTPLRAAVYQSLCAQDQPASAYQIADAVSASLDRRVAANTVYRLLDLFVSANLATRIESRNAYVASAHPKEKHDCIFLVCETCGMTRHLHDDAVARKVRDRARAAGFHQLKPVLEVKGQCASCHAAAA